jgi:hypothetical protein
MNATEQAARLERRIRQLTLVVIVGLVLSGLTAIPLETELGWAAQFLGLGEAAPPASGLGHWIGWVQSGLRETNRQYPFMAYGTDWLAFAHIVIAIAFVGAWREPVRNRWLFDFGLIAAGLVIPFALVMGGLRGIPFYWRLIDCSFGVGAAVPLWYCRQWARRLESLGGAGAARQEEGA